MPTQPSAYFPGPMSAQQLNSDMYSANATFTGATGVLFHTRRPLLSEVTLNSGTAYSPLIQQSVTGPGIEAFTVVDNTALYSIGADFPGVNSTFHFRDFVGTSGGQLGSYGGQWLTWGFPFLGAVTNAPGGVGAGMFLNGGQEANGVFQYGSTGHANCPWHLDLISPGFGSANAWQPSFWWLTASTPAIQSNPSGDTTGITTRMGWLWEGVSVGGTTVSSIPAPVTSWGTVTSAALNETLGSCLTLINNPPMLRVTYASSQSIPTNSNHNLILAAGANVDNYGGWSFGGTAVASTYTAPLAGLYLFSPTVGWGTVSSAGIRNCGLTVVSGGTGTTFEYMGPAYRATPVGPGLTGVGMTGTSVVRILNLHAGDVVSAIGQQTSGGALPLLPSYGTRLIGAYMGQLAALGTTLTYSVPDPSFRWQAGALAGTALTAAMNLHLGNDISFLMNRPYLTAHQSTPQSFGTASATFEKITMDTVAPLPYGGTGNGDNYGGWSSADNWYVSQVAGWYLCVADLYAVPPVSGTTALLTAGLLVNSSGGITPSSTPDIYQQVTYPIAATTGLPPGATAIGLYYLNPGEHVHPVLAQQNWGGTWGTYVATSNPQTYSQFSVFWVSS